MISGAVLWSGRVVGVATLAGSVAVVAVTLATVWRTAAYRSRAAAARDIEKRRPEFRNLLITSEELLRDPGRTPEWLRSRVVDDTSAVLCQGAGSSHIRMTGPTVAVAGSILLWTVTLGGVHRPVMEAVRENAAAALALVGGAPSVRVTITPPTYTATAVLTVTNPDRIDLLEGSRLQVVVDGGGGGGWRVRMGVTELAVTPDGNRWAAATRVTTSGYVAIEPNSNEQTGRRLIPVSVTPDRAPSVKVEAPGRDLLLPDASQRIPIRATAADDRALRSLELAYEGGWQRRSSSVDAHRSRNSNTTWEATASRAAGCGSRRGTRFVSWSHVMRPDTRPRVVGRLRRLRARTGSAGGIDMPRIRIGMP
jgi:hypothetical protein